MKRLNNRTVAIRIAFCASLALAPTGASSSPGATKATPFVMINQEVANAKITVTRLRPNISMLEGAGGNIAALTGRDGVLLVDAGIALGRTKLEAAIRKLEDAPIKYVVNTHWHWDHSDGDEWLHHKGAIIIAHRNTAKHLGQTIRVEEWGHTFTPTPVDARPTLLVVDFKELPFDGETVRFRHYDRSHTDGDLSVFFVKANVLATGDTWWNGMYPFIDYAAGGSIDGMINAANANIAMTNEKTAIVPGHGPSGTKAQLIESRNMLVAVRNHVAKLKHQGMSLRQVIAARPTTDFDAKYGHSIINAALFISLVYRGV